MNRTYNFQVDNGLFVAEYYLNKNYKNITIDDLKENTNMFANKMCKLNKLTVKNKDNKDTHISYITHLNTKLTQVKPKKVDSINIKKQLDMLLNNIGNDKVCMICGKKQVNINKIKRTDLKNQKLDYIPATSFMFGLPSLDKFFNKADNLQTIDVCPVCLFLAYISFLNTQKISFPFLYSSDSDEFMKDITNEIQNNVQINELLDIKQANLDKHFIDTMSKLMQDELIYGDMNYIDLVFFQNGKENYYEEQNVDKKKILFLLKLKNKGLINEFYKLRLFNPLLDNIDLFKKLINYEKIKLKCSKNLGNEIKGEFFLNEDLRIIDFATEVLLYNNNAEDLIKELKMIANKNEFEQFINKHSQNDTICRSLDDYSKLSNYKTWKSNYNKLCFNILLNNKREEN